MRFDILTLFPSMFENVFGESIIKRAIDKRLVKIALHNIRDFSDDRHKRVDDYPYGGGLGMVMQCGPIFSTLNHVVEDIGERPHVILMSPQGIVFNQKKAQGLLKHRNIAIICGHYEGIDERVLEELVDEEITIGDYILTGGEIAAMAVVDSVSRLIPGVLKEEESYSIETFSSGLLEYPQYTRPADFMGFKVPDILLSGHHKNIEKWRKYQSIKRTYMKRPDLLNSASLDENDKEVLKEIIKEIEKQ
ncbi:MAG: tRNA (guanosine(37)-N1)-methyltransferase TrmD [Firmicutes bacterium]|nr:tRNA (guanosine(37)-N1)-methyltransferase TrmD [Bacillota bacterium]